MGVYLAAPIPWKNGASILLVAMTVSHLISIRASGHNSHLLPRYARSESDGGDDSIDSDDSVDSGNIIDSDDSVDGDGSVDTDESD